MYFSNNFQLGLLGASSNICFNEKFIIRNAPGYKNIGLQSSNVASNTIGSRFYFTN